MEEVSNPSSHLPSLLLRPRAETRQCWSAPISLPGSPEKEVVLSNHGDSEQTGRDVELWSGSSTLRFLGAQHLRNLVTTSCNKDRVSFFPNSHSLIKHSHMAAKVEMERDQPRREALLSPPTLPHTCRIEATTSWRAAATPQPSITTFLTTSAGDQSSLGLTLPPPRAGQSTTASH